MRLSFAVACAVLVACGGPKPKTAVRDEVPVNSMAETERENQKKLRAAEAEAAAAPVATVSNEPVRGTVPPPGGGASAAPAAAAAAAVGPAGPAASKGGAGLGTKVSRAQCAQLFDKYIDLAVGGDAQLSGLGPELKGIVDQAKAQARSEKGDPCETEEVTRAKYDCGMSAKTTDAWQACMK